MGELCVLAPVIDTSGKPEPPESLRDLAGDANRDMRRLGEVLSGKAGGDMNAVAVPHRSHAINKLCMIRVGNETSLVILHNMPRFLGW